MSQTIRIPDLKEILTTGLQFGHSVSRWDPKMAKFIWGEKNGIHVIDIAQTKEALEKAAEFLKDAASKGDVIFVGTKKQAAGLVRDNAIRSGAHFIVDRWPGGMLTNFNMSQRSLRRLQELEKMFEEGVEGRTKYEVSRMKVEWGRLNRLYGGVKKLTSRPAAVIVIDPRYETVSVRECRKINIPVVALTDTNCDPTVVDYCIPGNDDALKAIEMVITVLADAVLAGNEGKGVQHELKDYTATEIKLVKASEEEEEKEEVQGEETAAPERTVMSEDRSKRVVKSKEDAGKGILELAREQAEGKEEPAKKAKPAKEAKAPANADKPAKAAKAKAAKKTK